jgi:23S rRNA (pseudouridine1915-N3)-methyltransferase
VKLLLIAVGRADGLLASAIAEYEARAKRYWPLELLQVKEERARGDVAAHAVREAEGERVLKRVPKGFELIALTRTGDAWTSERLSRHIQRTAVQSMPGIAFVIGGAYGLSDTLLRDAGRRMRLSTFTLPHDMARLMLLEQIYRAGTIARGEPYHKGRETRDE